jgi:2'-5' RNA ligase
VADARRLFFALWPQPGLQRTIAQATALTAEAAQVQGRLVRTEGLHMTLLFLGEVADGREEALKAAAAEVRFTPFSLKLDVVDSFARAKVLWLGCRETPDALGDLARQLRERVSSAGFEFDRKPLVPHVTVMRDINRGPIPVAIPPIAWTVAGFSLVHSAPGSRYHVVSHWSV